MKLVNIENKLEAIRKNTLIAFRKYPNVFTCLFILLVSSLPILLTRNSFTKSLSFTDTGEIGDTIGGITAPVIGLLSAFLLYRSFKAQILANELFRKSRNEDLVISNVNNWVDKIDKSIDNFTYGQLAGAQAINKVWAVVDTYISRGNTSYSTGSKDAYRGMFNQVLDERVELLTKIIADINSALIYIKRKDLDLNLFEVNLTLLSRIVHQNFQIDQLLKKLKIAVKNGYELEVPYADIHRYARTKELLGHFNLIKALTNSSNYTEIADL